MTAGDRSHRRSGTANEAGLADDVGNAIVEFVFLAVVVMIPLVYLIVAVAAVQRSDLAVTQAAREAGRAYATSDTAAQTAPRVHAAVRLALVGQGLPDDARVRFVAVGAACQSAPVRPSLAPGEQFTVCVIRRADVPGVPSVVQGHGVTTIGRYDVHVDDFRAAP